MLAGKPSRTAERVALRRAAHQVFDQPVVFHDPLALRILGLTDQHVRSGELRAPDRLTSKSLRAFLVARSRFAEDTLLHAVEHGCTQYVLLGAGLDTFAYRNANLSLRVFEVDHPDTQAWKRDLLQANGIAVPTTCTHVAVNFERDFLMDRLTEAGFQTDKPAVFAWLGVVPYLTQAAMQGTLDQLHALPATADLVLDYSLPREMLRPEEQLRFDSLCARVAGAGEPFQQFFAPAAMEAVLHRSGFRVLEDLDGAALNRRYFTKRADGLQVLGMAGHLLHAQKTQLRVEMR